MGGFGSILGSCISGFAPLAVGLSGTVFVQENQIGSHQPVEGSVPLGADNKDFLNSPWYFADEFHAAGLEILKNHHRLLTAGGGGDAAGGNCLHIGTGCDFLQFLRIPGIMECCCLTPPRRCFLGMNTHPRRSCLQCC